MTAKKLQERQKMYIANTKENIAQQIKELYNECI